MKNMTIRALSGICLLAFGGLLLSACTTVVREPAPSAVVVKEKTPDVIVVPD